MTVIDVGADQTAGFDDLSRPTVARYETWFTLVLHDVRGKKSCAEFPARGLTCTSKDMIESKGLGLALYPTCAFALNV